MRDLWSTVQADHDLLWGLLNGLTGGPGRPVGGAREQQRLARRLVAAASTHEAAEALVLWPVLRARCPDGEEVVGEVLAQEADATRALEELAHISAGTTEFAECVNTVAGLTRRHVSYEDAQVWPRLADHVPPDLREDLAGRWLAARRAAPTRPHPHAAVDRARDALAGRRVPAP